ncbi:MAG: cytosolic protein [Ectobacillus sp.]
MSLIQKVKQFFSTQAETADSHMDEALKSRYYKTNQKNALKAVQDMLRGMKEVNVTSVSDERGEISATIMGPKKAFLIVTIITIRPFETAIDFTVSTETVLPTDFGFSKRIIKDMYERLDKQLVFVGNGLGEKL